MNETFTLAVELTSRETEIEIEIDVEVEYHWENDGIGAYEYWGAKCYDKGTNYVEIDSTDFDSTGLTPDDVKEIEAAIEKQLDSWTTELTEKGSDDEPDYERD